MAGRIRKIIDEYCYNADRREELKAIPYSRCEKKEWLRRMKNRAEKLRLISSQNEQLAERLRKILGCETDEEGYEELYEQALRLYNGGCGDTAILYPMLEKLFEHYHQTAEFKKRLFIYRAISDVCGDGAIGKSGVFGPEELIPYVFALKPHYAELSEDARKIFWIMYHSYIVADIGSAAFDINRSYQRYREMKAFWDSSEVQRLDGNNRAFQNIISEADRDYTAVERSVGEASEEVKGSLYRFAEACYKKECEEKGDPDLCDPRVCALYLRMQAEMGKADLKQIIKRYFAYYRKRLSMLSGAGMPLASEQRFFADAPEVLFRWTISLPDEKQRTEQIRSLIGMARESMISEFKVFPSGFINHVLNRWCFSVTPYLSGAKEKEEWISSFIIRRQPAVYLHSVMVSRMARAYAVSAAEKIPGYFAGLPEAQRRDVPDYLARCGIFHDVGKTRVTGITDLQGRRLSDEEFGYIKKHSDFGSGVLERDPDLICYADVARGHHRFYDGSGGYPADYDPSASPYQSAVNIIRICDSLDAATDHLGRSYKRAKDFDTVREELKAGAGTSYDPGLVRLLDEDPVLAGELRFLCTEGREDIMYEAYIEGCDGAEGPTDTGKEVKAVTESKS